MLVTRIVSGGQTGADLGGLKTGKQLGLLTGGWVPKGCRTLDGPNPELVTVYGCTEHTSDKYPPRTEANVAMADGTVRFARNFYSPGELCTLKAVNKHGKPYIDVCVDLPTDTATFLWWLRHHSIRTLNVAGNSERTCPGIEAFVVEFLVTALTE